MISMLRALLAKDFARTRRNPLPWLLFLLAPLCVAGIIGFAFGGSMREQRIGTLRCIVDEVCIILWVAGDPHRAGNF